MSDKVLLPFLLLLSSLTRDPFLDIATDPHVRNCPAGKHLDALRSLRTASTFPGTSSILAPLVARLSEAVQDAGDSPSHTTVLTELAALREAGISVNGLSLE
jgi:hypothetical protein